MYFIDTNVILEIALKQEKFQRAKDFFNSTDEPLYISDLSLYSIGIILHRLKKEESFNLVINEIESSGFTILSLPFKKLYSIHEVIKRFGLDFEDSYQYLLAESHRLMLVTFDKDFDRTDIKRINP